MVLVDTSVWIDLYRDRKNQPATQLRQILETGHPFAVTPLIVQELLQGAADEREFALLHDYFTTQRMIVPADSLSTHCRAARLYFDCRRHGFTPRSSADCLIAQIAIDHQLALLHNDRDFERIGAVTPQLKLLP
jgi:predicted nucleic acid-binding protein